MGIIIKSDQEIEKMRQAGHIVAEVLALLAEQVKAGIETIEIDRIAEGEIRKRGAKPSFKGYRGFPASVCVSVNDEIVHGIPGKRTLKEGDIVSLDLGDIYLGYQGDTAVTVGIGNVSKEATDLMETTRGALAAGIGAALPGNRLGDISAAVFNYADSRGYAVVREYTGHGIGREMHEDPLIPNFGAAGTGPVLKKGMTLAIEPMLIIGTDYQTKVGANMWTVYTNSGNLSAHFEHTIAITGSGAEILTVCKGGYA